MAKLETLKDVRDAASEIYERLKAHPINVDQADKMRACLGEWTRGLIAEMGARRERRSCEDPSDMKALDKVIGDKLTLKTIEGKGKKQLSEGKK